MYVDVEHQSSKVSLPIKLPGQLTNGRTCMYICTMSSKLHVGDNKAGIMKPPIARYHKKPGYDNGKYTNVYVRCIYTVHVIWYKYSFYMCMGHVHLCVFIAFNIASLTALRSGP